MRLCNTAHTGNVMIVIHHLHGYSNPSLTETKNSLTPTTDKPNAPVTVAAGVDS